VEGEAEIDTEGALGGKPSPAPPPQPDSHAANATAKTSLLVQMYPRERHEYGN
jgi:hypothetical protein